MIIFRWMGGRYLGVSFPSPVNKMAGYYALRGNCYTPLLAAFVIVRGSRALECRVGEWEWCGRVGSMSLMA
jgi:hypothetical protein